MDHRIDCQVRHLVLIIIIIFIIIGRRSFTLLFLLLFHFHLLCHSIHTYTDRQRDIQMHIRTETDRQRHRQTLHYITRESLSVL